MNVIDAHNWVENQFIAHFLSHGYIPVESVKITSRVDPTVYLVNSATNLFKHYFHEKNIGVFAVQKSMRTQILTDFYREGSETEYPSFFESYGAYVSLDKMDSIITDTVDFFSAIGLNQESMRFRASTDDTILADAIAHTSLAATVVWDERSYKYDHIYGDGITGRAIKLDYYQEWANKFKNLCYFILIYDNGIPIGMEMATSDQLILIRSHNLRYAICASKISAILPLDSFSQRRFADSIAGIAHMTFEGVRPNSSNTNGRTLKKYIHAAISFGRILGYSPVQITEIIDRYTLLEYNCYCDEDLISDYLQRLEKPF